MRLPLTTPISQQLETPKPSSLLLFTYTGHLRRLKRVKKSLQSLFTEDKEVQLIQPSPLLPFLLPVNVNKTRLQFIDDS